MADIEISTEQKVPQKRGRKKRSRGCPSKFRPRYTKEVKKICALGATDDQLADFYNVTVTTINNWKKKYPKFFESIKKGKTIADAEVAHSTYHAAIGYSHPSEEIKVVSQGGNAGSVIERVLITKQYPPDIKAAQYWLNNRRKTDWKDRQQIDLGGKVETAGPPVFVVSNQQIADDLKKVFDRENANAASSDDERFPAES